MQMPRTYPASPPMTQVSTGDPDRSLQGTRYPNHYYPHYEPPQQPPRACLPQSSPGHSKSPSNEPRQITRALGSVSSDGTASSSPSLHKHHPSRTSVRGRQYQLSSHAERGSMGDSAESRNGYQGTNAGSVQESTGVGHVAVYQYIRGEQREEEKDHAIWILMWLSFLDPLFSLFSAIFSLVVVLFLLLISPIRWCQPSCSVSISTVRTIAPVFRHHLGLIYAPSVDEAHTFDFKPVMLVLIHVISPVLSMGVAVAAWTSAAFWLFALMMGNPDGTERRDDGRAAVLGVRDWWEKFLLNAVR